MGPRKGDLAQDRPARAAHSPIQRVAVIGAGPMGTNLALRFAQAGFHTTLEDVLPARLRQASAREPLQAAGVYFATSIEDAVRDADLAIDTVPDELESKLEILTLLDRMAPPATLFATPIETLSIADLASCTYRPGQCFGLRFVAGDRGGFESITIMAPPAGVPETVDRLAECLRTLGATVTVERDTSALP
jgi:3-hydroxybutyryl-CoA dehydrogenase